MIREISERRTFNPRDARSGKLSSHRALQAIEGVRRATKEEMRLLFSRASKRSPHHIRSVHSLPAVSHVRMQPASRPHNRHSVGEDRVSLIQEFSIVHVPLGQSKGVRRRKVDRSWLAPNSGNPLNRISKPYNGILNAGYLPPLR